MPNSQVRSRASASNGRMYMPSIDTVMPSEDKLSEYRSDSAMTRAFGLEQDMKHWSRMKADGMKFCQEQLPPPRLTQRVKEKLGLSHDTCKKLEWYGGVKTSYLYLWEFGLASWKEKYDYDIQYLQKRFPSIDVKNIICSLVSTWNCDTSAKNLPRKYAEGRDISQLYFDLISKAKAYKGNVIDFSTELHSINERSVPDLIHTDVSSDFTSRFSVASTRYASHNHLYKTGRRDNNLDWKNVLLGVQHVDHTESRLQALPLLLVCRSVPIMPGNVRMDIVKEELQKQAVTTDDFHLKLRGSQGTLS